jgi:hypothetical protein
VGFVTFFAPIIAMADCSRKGMSKNQPDAGTATSLGGPRCDYRIIAVMPDRDELYRGVGIATSRLSIAAIIPARWELQIAALLLESLSRRDARKPRQTYDRSV